MRRPHLQLLVAAVFMLLLLAPQRTEEAMATAEAQAVRPQADFAYIAGLDELTDQHARLFRLYWTYFDRQPDPAGAVFWIDQHEKCRGLRSIASFFTNSPEFVDTYGELDDDQFIDLVYANVLDRSPDDGGRRYWRDRLASGSIDRTGLMLDFSFSAEFVARHPLPSDGVPGRPCASPQSRPSVQPYRLQDWQPFATAGPVTLSHPSAAVGQIGFHQSSHDGARQLLPLTVDTPWLTMEDRGRGTPPRSAVDIAVHPSFEIRSPVTGTVSRAGGYVLYCRYNDDFVVVEPEERPGWEVKVLHLDGVQVAPGDRVVAGETVLAPAAATLPFRSQIDEFTAEPSWGHVHIEVVDPSIPDRPSAGC